MHNYFAICKTRKSYKFRNQNILGKKPFEIILSKLEKLEIEECYNNNSTFEGSLFDILDWAVSKHGNLIIVDERAVLLRNEDYYTLLNRCNSESPLIAAINKHSNQVVAMACSIDALIFTMSKLNLASDTINELYHMLLANNVDMKHYCLDYNYSLLLDSNRDFSIALNKLSQEINNNHMEQGVLFINPDTCFIDFGVKIANNTLVYPGNILKGETEIGSNCILYPNNRITNATIGNDNTIESSVIIDSSIGNNTIVGPFAYIRPGSNISNNCRIGDFVEIKNSSIGDETKISHLTYVGDSDLGNNINIGCGVVFVNYDGKIKQRSKIENNAFIGCNTNIIAPVTVEENAYVAAGSTITENVPKDSLHISRSRAVIKENWAKNRREDGRL